MKKITKEEKGITLIALVITIIVLLILAGISIAMLTGDNGILKKVTTAKQQTIQSSAEEKVKIAVAGSFDTNGKVDVKDLTNNLQNIEGINKSDLPITKLPALVTVDGYTFSIDKNGKVELSGPRPVVSGEIVTLEDGSTIPENGVEIGTKLKIEFTATIEGGTIESISPAIPYVTNGSEKEVTFTIIGKVDGVTYTTQKIIEFNNNYNTYDSLINAVSDVNESTYKEIRVEKEKMIYNANIIVHNSDLLLDGTTGVDGAILNSNIYEFGNAQTDVGNETKEAKNMVILKVNGDLTINNDITLTSCKSENGYGGPKGLMIYCTGTITNNGTISMTKRGAKATGENVYLYKNNDGTFEIVPAIGAIGGKGVKADSRELGDFQSLNGNNGENGINRATGGGGSGSAYAHDHTKPDVALSGAGSAGTSYSGGSGGGACSAVWTYDDSYFSLDSDATFSGGNAYGSYNSEGYPCGGGAGNPGGDGFPEEDKGTNGTGGLLIIYCEKLYNNKTIMSNGSKGGIAKIVFDSINVNSDGGCSGGGSINIFAKTLIDNNGLIQADGGSNNSGGAGGKGTINMGYIENNQYRSIR